MSGGDYVDSLIEAAERGDKQAAAELNRRIHSDLECGALLDDRLAAYVARNGLQPKGKRTDTGTRDIGFACAVVLRMERGENRQAAIQAVADLGHASFKTVEAAFKGGLREEAEAWAKDPARRRRLVACAAPYLA